MELTKDVLLRGPIWARAIDKLTPIFKTRTNYSIYMLCISIGIMYDQRIEKFDEDEDYLGILNSTSEEDNNTPRNVPRNVMQNNDNGKMDFMFQAAILSTKTEQLTEDERLELAFGEGTDFDKLNFLTQFANYGVTKLAEQIGETLIESMENIKGFLTSTIEGNNFDINAIPDDVWLDDDMGD